MAICARDFKIFYSIAEKANQDCKPFIKIWCAAHRSNLVYKSVAKSVPEVSRLQMSASDLATFFHVSGSRSRKLTLLAQEKNLTKLHLPKTFTVRFTQFSLSLLEALLESWPALMTFLSDPTLDDELVQRQGFLAVWTERNTLQLTCFLRDVLFVFSRFQKRLQLEIFHFLGIKIKLNP